MRISQKITKPNQTNNQNQILFRKLRQADEVHDCFVNHNQYSKQHENVEIATVIAIFMINSHMCESQFRFRY